MDHTIARALSHVYWIGGSPCSGKSTIADSIASEMGWTSYRCDDAWYRHEKIVDPDRHPIFYRLRDATGDAVWMRPVDVQIREELAVYEEEFSLILDDLLAMPTDRPVVAEGAALLPNLVHDLGIAADRMIWIVPTPEFQVLHYGQRQWRHDVLATCSDPDQAWANWMQRDIGFAQAVRERADARDLACIVVDGQTSLAENEATVRQQFGLITDGGGILP